MKGVFPLPPDWFQDRYIYLPSSGHVISRLSERPIGTLTPEGYLVVNIFKRTYKVHRIAWAIYYGEWPVQIDHINHDRADNRLENLRNVTNHTNGKNTKLKKNNKSGFTGINFRESSGKWIVTIQHKGKSIYLGSYSEIEDAIEARRQAEEELGFHPNHGKNQEDER